ncbi:MAG TPA: cytochrome C oxidase subunit IV family protein [Terriglobales bacterium]|jgi:cytochrome c oxidase subunit IV|nr:cytochrome C oxidase subunit IV family protein [Terriglobales bacterium]
MADHKEHAEHIVSAGLYWLIWFILIVGTVVTALVATVDLGTYHGIDFNTIVALLIATCKASIVVLIFMHVKYTSEKMTKAILLSAIFWLLLLLVLSMSDYSTRMAG